VASKPLSRPVGRVGTRRLHPLPCHLSFFTNYEPLDEYKAMPSSSSAKKRVRQNVKRRLKNRVTKKVIKTLIKRTLASAAATELDKVASDIKTAASKIDKAGARRVLHPNTAARRKSKLARAQNAALAKSQQA
jgi:small subunit ribosomal protein S20